MQEHEAYPYSAPAVENEPTKVFLIVLFDSKNEAVYTRKTTIPESRYTRPKWSEMGLLKDAIAQFNRSHLTKSTSGMIYSIHPDTGTTLLIKYDIYERRGI